mmetsp:Transcript_16715/g.56246  ORF Transcript_16715/g.56246 Transcript_16715/m.56246 type:complete len:332 (+) Transcript_16715:917-1912(+)
MATSERWQVANPCAPLLCPLLSPLPLSRPPVSAASQLGRGRGEEPVAVQPARVLDGPPDRLAQRLLKGEGQLPSQLLELGPVERVTQVVTGSRVWPVVHLVDQLAAQLRRDEAGHLEVVELRLPLDVVLFAELGLVQHKEDRRGDVARMDVEARARAERAVIGVDDQLLAWRRGGGKDGSETAPRGGRRAGDCDLAAKDARDAERDELLGVLPLAERVHHVHRHERHAVGVEVRLADHLGRRLGGRVRVGRLVRVPLLECLPLLRRAEYLVRGEVDEVGQVRQRARKLEHGEGGLDVVLDEGDGRVNRVVDVRLCGDVQDHRHAVWLQLVH